MTELTTAWMLGCVCGFFMGVTVAGRRRPTCRELMRDPDRQPTFAELLMPLPRDRDPDWRRSFSHENTNRPSMPPPLRLDPGRTQRGNGNGGPSTPKPDIVPSISHARTTRWFINNPVQIAECGGPCTAGPEHCDCGALWVDVPKPQRPGGYQPRSQRGPTNPPPRNP